MGETVIRVRGIGKQYRIGLQREGYKTLRDSIKRAFESPVRRLSAADRPSRSEMLWALKDVSFDIARGDVIGVIGHNGAGKSTLLKVLSRITEPTEGFAEIRGRVGSLLEVGTGFHAELTGRENIFLNGAILGMRREEIKRRFDEIVAFAEVERFIDTPVKHYSSGMYLRLAFAVAAHLELEILLVDEVLAVGDAAFQNKCLGKMQEATRQDRTVLFVSHNLAALKSLCPSALLLKEGRVAFQGATEDAIGKYLLRDPGRGDPLSSFGERQGEGPVRLTRVEVLDQSGCALDVAHSGQAIAIELAYGDEERYSAAVPLVFHIFFSSSTGERLFVCSTRFGHPVPDRLPASGVLRCLIPVLPLVPSHYALDIVCKAGKRVLDYVARATTLTVVSGDFFGSGRLPPPTAGPMLVENSWLLLDAGMEAANKTAGLVEWRE